MSIEPAESPWKQPSAEGARHESRYATFADASVVQLLSDAVDDADAEVLELHQAMVTVAADRIAATDGDVGWTWMVADITAIVHGTAAPWTIIVVPGVDDFGVSVPVDSVADLRAILNDLPGVDVRYQHGHPAVPVLGPPSHLADQTDEVVVVAAPIPEPIVPITEQLPVQAPMLVVPAVALAAAEVSVVEERLLEPAAPAATHVAPSAGGLAGLDAREISAWFGERMVLDRVSLHMAAGEVTALIGPSGCGKSTFLRILNRMHEMIPSAAMAGEVLLDGHDIYDPNRKLTDARREIGMVFQKPNPFPAMSIYDNVLASFRLTGVKASAQVKDEVVEACLAKAGLWNEVRDRLRQPGGGLSGGQQQRLCIARALAIKPRVLLMDEPCSALDPTSTRRIEETVMQLASEVTIVIVTHNMQQAARVSNQCAFFLAEQGTPGVIVEHGPTTAMFGSPQDPRTSDYVMGRFG